MPKNTRISALVGAGVTAALLVACGGGTDAGAPSPNADGSTTLDMWVFAELHGAVYEEMTDQWNRQNPDRQVDLRVTVYPYVEMHNKLQLALSSGAGVPDVVDIEVSKFSNFVKGSTPPLADLTAAAAPYRDDIVPARLDLYSRDGVVYGYPTHVGAFVASYNTELLEGAGVDYTTIETWDDFEAAGVAYHEGTGKNFGIASSDVLFVESLVVAQKGGEFFDEAGDVALTSPEVVETLEMFQDMQEAGAIATIPGGSPDIEAAFGAINDGDFAALVYPAWYTSRFVDYMPDLDGKIAIAPAPVTADPVVRTIGGGGTGTAVPTASPNQELATDWLAFAKLSMEANVAVWEVLGFDPVNMAVWDDESITHDPDNKFNKYFQTNLFDVLNEVRDGIGHFESYNNPNLPIVDNVLRTVTLTEIYENGVPARDALARSQADLENELG